MIDRRALLAATGIVALGGAVALGRRSAQAASPAHYPVTLTDAQWKAKLSPAAYEVLRHAGTEPPYTSPLLNQHAKGTFVCDGCAQPLYSSTTKYDSGTGWPSFWAPLPHAILTSTDLSLLVPRTEVHCIRCGGHLGHVFDDGPQPTGKRYCMNGVAMGFHAA
jgi:peptide-methionine (R)-S-oxide reductase